MSRSQAVLVVILAGFLASLAIWSRCSPMFVGNNPHVTPPAGQACLVTLVAKNWVETPLEEFSIALSGRPIDVPVRLANCTLKFLVDTGAAKTAFDKSVIDELGLRDALHTTMLRTPAGDVPVEVFTCPPAFVGEQALDRVESIVCCDLEPIRYATGMDIVGIIGMDFLVDFAVQIDFDKGSMQLYDKAPNNWQTNGVQVPMSIWQGCPVIEAQLPGITNEQFILDTGADVSSVSNTTFDRLCSSQALTLATHQHGVAVGGMLRGQSGNVADLTIGPFRHQRIRLDRNALSTIGLSYVSRYLVRFDFPNSLLYLTPGERFAEQESVATSGLAILQIDGQKTVINCRKGSAADECGIRVGDVILRVDGNPADQIDMFQLRSVLTSEVGRKVAITVANGSEVREVIMALQSRLPHSTWVTETHCPTCADGDHFEIENGASVSDSHASVTKSDS